MSPSELVRRLRSRVAHSFLTSRTPVALAWVAIVALLLTTAVLFRRTPSGALAAYALIAAAGAGAAALWTRLSLPAWLKEEWLRSSVAVLVTLALSAIVWWDPIVEGRLHFTRHDWGIHFVLVRELFDGLERGRIPHWLMNVSTGDSPFELYPLFTYWLAAVIARIAGSAAFIPTILTAIGVVAHVLSAANVARLAVRLGPWPLAAIAGLFAALDEGGLYAGGIVASLEFGLIHQTVSLVFILAAACAVIDVIRAPGILNAIRVWGWTAIGVFAHPSGLVIIAAMFVGLVLAALLARDFSVRSLLAAMLHLGIGAALPAMGWAPYAARVMQYGAHYGNPSEPASLAFERLMSAELPISTFAAIFSVALAGAIVAFFARRGAAIVIATTGALLLLGFVDVPYLLTDVAASLSVARFAPFRLGALSKPFLIACLPALSYVITSARAPEDPSSLGRYKPLVAGALLAVVSVMTLRGAVPLFEERTLAIQRFIREDIVDRTGFEELVRWAKYNARSLAPGSYGRLYYENEDHFIFELAARSGLPVIHPGPIPCMFLRERMEDVSPGSLRRFAIRWAARRGGPPALGDPTTQRQFGAYFVRSIPTWDGKLARVERGEGDAVVTVLEDERLVVDLRNTSRRALVALGIGYYPRWRATHDGTNVPVYGMRGTSTASSRVVAAWLPPGKTVFTPDGPLPSDTRGRFAFALAVLLAAFYITSKTWAPLRARVQRVDERTTAFIIRHRSSLIVGVLVLIAVALLVRGILLDARPARALTVGTGLVRDAWVQVLPNRSQAWQSCRFAPALSRFRCGDYGIVAAGIMHAIRGQDHSWPYATPVVAVHPLRRAEYRIVMKRSLGGRYITGLVGNGATATLAIDGVGAWSVSRAPITIDIPERRAPRRIVMTIAPAGEISSVGFVRADTLDVDRTRDIPEPPAN